MKQGCLRRVGVRENASLHPTIPNIASGRTRSHNNGKPPANPNTHTRTHKHTHTRARARNGSAPGVGEDEADGIDSTRPDSGVEESQAVAVDRKVNPGREFQHQLKDRVRGAVAVGKSKV